jgi:prevent-host-death family protein
MNEPKPTTQTVQLSEVTRQLTRLVDQVSHGQNRIVVERDGVPVAAFVSVQDLARLEHDEQERAERFRILDEIGAAFADVPADELEAEVARALDEVRAERRAEAKQVIGAKT